MESFGKLIDFPVSHYCEKAKWALEYVGISFMEEHYAPVLHRFMFKIYQFEGTSVPIYIYKDEEGKRNTLKDSSDIVLYANSNTKNNKKLLPDDNELIQDINNLEKLFDEKLGPATRMIAYYYILDDTNLATNLFTTGISTTQALVVKYNYFIIKRVMKQFLSISEQGYIKALKDVDEIFKIVEDKLYDGRKYIAGENLSIADITFASLASPILIPKENKLYYENMKYFSEDFLKIIEKYRNSYAGKFALKVYEENRK